MNQHHLPASEDYGPFGRPLFDDESIRHLKRVGVVDVGSNSVRMVVFDGAARSPAYFFNEKVMCGLGEGLGETGHMSPTGRVRALRALERFQAIANGMGLEPLTVVATAAVRDAIDGPSFCEEVKERTGLTVHVVPGEEEARLSAQGVLLGWPGSYGLVCDIGGSSMELAEINGGQVGKRVTSDLGPQKLRGVKGGRRARRDHIDAVLADLSDRLGPQSNRLFLVGGSWRAIARIDMERQNYPLHVLHEYRMKTRDVSRTAKFIAKSDKEELRQRCGISAARMQNVPLASEVLARLVKKFKPHDIAISSYGIREGMLYEQMPQKLKDRDPLIEACRFAEKKDARLPGFGRVLYRFVEPLFAKADPERKRLIRAACLLHDVSWRAHPDYRADVTFDYATRANLGGLKHAERVFLALALLHRYRSSRQGTLHEALFDLLSKKDQQAAEVLGKAMRFGAMLWHRLEDPMGSLKWQPKKRHLTLKLDAATAPLFGEVAEARFASLAAALEATSSVKIDPA